MKKLTIIILFTTLNFSLLSFNSLLYSVAKNDISEMKSKKP
jgi:hypothetical protein